MDHQHDITNKQIFSIAPFGFSILIGFWLIFGVSQSKKSQYYYTLDTGWDIYENGVLITEDGSVSDTKFGTSDAGTVIDLYTTAPSKLNGGYTLEFLVYLCSVEVFVNDNEIYSYGTDIVGTNVMVGSGYHFVNLPNAVGGKEIHIQFILNEDNAFTSIEAPKAVSTENCAVAFARTQIVNSLIGDFLVVLGLILTIISLIAIFYDRVYIRLIYIGLFSTLIGVWTIITTKSVQMFSLSRVTYTNFEYITLYFAPVPFAFLIVEMRQNDELWRKVILRIMAGILLGFATAAVVLHYTNILRFPSMLNAFHITGIVSILVLVFAGVISVKERRASESVTAMGIIILILVLGLDICRFNLQKYIFPNVPILMISLLPLGTLIFVIFLIVSYMMYMYDMVMSKTEKETLTKLAYHDVLTGLYNRASYEEKLQEIDQSDEEFALISIDVNGLKEVNDRLGHNKGDVLLTTFAELVKKNFSSIGYCYRTGGDEYMIIVTGQNIEKISSALVDLNMDEKDASSKLDFDVMASYGIAYRSEVEAGDSYSVFRLADKRMYEMKSTIKGRKYAFAAERSTK